MVVGVLYMLLTVYMTAPQNRCYYYHFTDETEKLSFYSTHFTEKLWDIEQNFQGHPLVPSRSRIQTQFSLILKFMLLPWMVEHTTTKSYDALQFSGCPLGILQPDIQGLFCDTLPLGANHPGLRVGPILPSPCSTLLILFMPHLPITSSLSHWNEIK